MFSTACNFRAVRAWKVQIFMGLNEKTTTKTLTKTMMANCHLQDRKSMLKKNRLTETNCFSEHEVLLHFRIQYKLTLSKNLQYDVLVVLA